MATPQYSSSPGGQFGNMQQMQQQQQQQQQQNPQQSQQQQQQQVPIQQQTSNGGQQAPNPSSAQQQQPSAPKETLTLLNLCSIGQETVQDIVTRFQEIFKFLTAIHPPNGTNQGNTVSLERKLKVQELFRTIRVLFKRLRLLYDRSANESGQYGFEYTHIETLVPIKDEPDCRPEPIMTEEYKRALAENRKLVEIVTQKNKTLREVIDKLRITIWEINTMLGMRRS